MAGQLWATDNLGGFMYSDQLSETLRTSLQPLTRYRNMCSVEDAKEAGTGEKYNWNVYSDVATGGAALVETQPMPETNFSIDQETLTITEYGNSVPYTRKLDILSKHSCERVIDKVLKNDARKTLDKAAHAEFDKTKLVCYPAGAGADSATDVVFETDGAPAGTNNAAMTKDHVKKIVDYMQERDITPMDGENYGALGRPTTFRQLKDDLEAISFYIESGFARIAAGEIGRYESTRFFTQTNVPTEAWTNGKSDAAHFFGDDTVAEAIVEPEQIRAKLPGDYGRSRGMAWYYMGGFGICHTVEENSRIVKWSSAA
ncbi:hypothetical protein [Hahella ganghwensis]|uniref:phage major capsid protein n=1 Tax=Hahella ganghwensis TaxID=286420 RepID=UPI000373EFA6|nr:hypothetical protein [Hahella ganghwensis]